MYICTYHHEKSCLNGKPFFNIGAKIRMSVWRAPRTLVALGAPASTSKAALNAIAR